MKERSAMRDLGVSGLVVVVVVVGPEVLPLGAVMPD